MIFDIKERAKQAPQLQRSEFPIATWAYPEPGRILTSSESCRVR